MNIALINSARTWGGTEKWTLMAADALQKRHTVRLIYRRDIVGSRFSIPTHQLPLTSHIDPYSLARLVALIKKEKIEILIPTKRKDYVLAGIASRICGITNIIRLGIDRRLRIPCIHKLIYRDLADGIIVNAEKTRQTLLHSPFMSSQHIKVIYNGLDTRQIDSDITPPPEKPAPFLVTAMGILTRRKGFDVLIRGFREFLRTSPDADAALVIIGDGPDKTAFLSLCRELGIADRVVFTGFLASPFGWLKQSDVFAMTSRNEGIPNALLEAMYLGNAPVCTPAGGTAEVISHGQNGLLVDYDNPAGLGEALSALWSDRSFTCALAEGARQKVLEQFSLETMSLTIESFCRDTAAMRRHP